MDDLLREAVSGRLARHPHITVEKSGRIGPLVEFTLASTVHRDQYGSVSVVGEFAQRVAASFGSKRPFGSGYSEIAGVFPFGVANPVTSSEPDWDLWTAHAENVGTSKGLSRRLVGGLLGALGELQDNLYEHSGHPETGLVAYAVRPESFEFVVADQGIGVLSSLRQNPKYTALQDSGVALELAITDGISRFGAETGHGRGFSQLFRALVGHNAEIRFRSGDHSLTLCPAADTATGTKILTQVAPLNGLCISVLCTVRRPRN